MSRDRLPPELLVRFDMVTNMLAEALISAYEAGQKAAAPRPAPPAKPAPIPARAPVQALELKKWNARDFHAIADTHARVFNALEVLLRSRDMVTQNQVAKACGYPEASYVVKHLVYLESLGYVRNFGQAGFPNWRCVISGPVYARAISRPVVRKPSPPASKPAPILNKAPEPQKVTPPPPEPAAESPAPAAPTPKPAPPVDIPKKTYPPVASLRPVSRIAPQHRSPSSSQITQAVFGADGNGGARAEVGDKGGIKVSTYLSRRGHMVAIGRGGWHVDGKFMDRYDVLELINEYRAKSDIPPCTADDLE